MALTEQRSAGTPVEWGPDIDPITFSVMLSRFQDIANEMTLTLEYTAWLDDPRARARLLVRDLRRRGRARSRCWTPCRSTRRSMHLVLDEIAETFKGKVHEGDIFMCNAPYRNNTHIGDLVTAEPVFVDGEQLFWSVTKGHQLDIGGFAPSSVLGDARDAVAGRAAHPAAAACTTRGEPRADVIDLYLANMRYRESSAGDLLAQLGSIGKGRVRLEELVAEYGADGARCATSHAIIDYADRRMARASPRDPGRGRTPPRAGSTATASAAWTCRSRSKVTVADDQVDVDFTGSGPQSPSGLNGTYATLQGARGDPVHVLHRPRHPAQPRLLRAHRRSFAPEGTICNAEYPASTSAARRSCRRDAMHDVVNKAMAAAIPDKVVAGGAALRRTCRTSRASTERTGEAWGAMLFNNGGGGGARKGADGWPMIATLAAIGGLKALVDRAARAALPARIHRDGDRAGLDGRRRVDRRPGHALRGRGRRTGSMEVVTFGDGQRNPPHGVLGGTPGHRRRPVRRERRDGARRYVSATGYYRVAAGEQCASASRPAAAATATRSSATAEQRRRDVRDGMISRETGARACSASCSATTGTRSIDEAATPRAARELARRSAPLRRADERRRVGLAADAMREGDDYFDSTPVSCLSRTTLERTRRRWDTASASTSAARSPTSSWSTSTVEVDAVEGGLDPRRIRWRRSRRASRDARASSSADLARRTCSGRHRRCSSTARRSRRTR